VNKGKRGNLEVNSQVKVFREPCMSTESVCFQYDYTAATCSLVLYLQHGGSNMHRMESLSPRA